MWKVNETSDWAKAKPGPHFGEQKPKLTFFTHSYMFVVALANSAVFFNIVQTAFDPPPLVLNMYVAIFFEGL